MALGPFPPCPPYLGQGGPWNSAPFGGCPQCSQPLGGCGCDTPCDPCQRTLQIYNNLAIPNLIADLTYNWGGSFGTGVPCSVFTDYGPLYPLTFSGVAWGTSCGWLSRQYEGYGYIDLFQIFLHYDCTLNTFLLTLSASPSEYVTWIALNPWNTVGSNVMTLLPNTAPTFQNYWSGMCGDLDPDTSLPIPGSFRGPPTVIIYPA